MSYRRFVVVRLLWTVIVLWLVATFFFVAFFVVQLHAAENLAFLGPPGTDQYLRGQNHFDDSRPAQYLYYLHRLVVHRSPGTGIEGDSGKLARHALPATLSVVVSGLCLALLVAGIAGTLLARLRWRRVYNLPIYIAVGSSPIWIGLLLSRYLGGKAGLPYGGYCEVFNPPEDARCGGLGDWASHLVLPAVALALFFAAIYTRVIRAGVRWVDAAGDVEERKRRRRTVRSELARSLACDFGFALGLSLFVEKVFSIPGLGSLVIYSYSSGSLFPMLAAVLVATVAALAFQLVVALVVGAVDPDVRDEWSVARRPKPA